MGGTQPGAAHTSAPGCAQGRGRGVCPAAPRLPAPLLAGCPFSSLHSSSKDKSKAVLQVSGGPCGCPAGLPGPEPPGSAQTWPHSPCSGLGLVRGVPGGVGRGELGPRRPSALVPRGWGHPHPPDPLCLLQQKYVRCSVRAQIRHLRKVLCHRLGLQLQHVSGVGNGLGGHGPWVGIMGPTPRHSLPVCRCRSCSTTRPSPTT